MDFPYRIGSAVRYGPHQTCRLVSPSFTPCVVEATSTDDRRLGAMIQAIAIDDLLGTVTEILLDDPALVAGFNPLESGSGSTWRWTKGDALLSAAMFLGAAGPRILRLNGWCAMPERKQAIEEAA